MEATEKNIFELPELRNRTQVFRDRGHAGTVLADMLAAFHGEHGFVLGIPAGGVPVAAEIARRLRWPLDVAVVSKITLPWNTEAGYGAVAFDGTVRLNQELIERLALGEEVVQEGIARTREKVRRRVARLRGDRPFPDLRDCFALLVDDGLASGFTLLTAVDALRKLGAAKIVAALPTGHLEAVHKIVAATGAVYCANIRQGWGFAVAEAYENWSDVAEDVAVRTLEDFTATMSRHGAQTQRE